MIYRCQGHNSLVNSDSVGVNTVEGKAVCNTCFRNYQKNKTLDLLSTMVLLSVALILIGIIL